MLIFNTFSPIWDRTLLSYRFHCGNFEIYIEVGKNKNKISSCNISRVIFFLKVPVRLEKSDWVFRCHGNAICYAIIWIKIRCLATASYLYAIALSNCIKVDLTSIQSQNAQMENFQSIVLWRITEFIEMHSSEQQLSWKLHSLSYVFCCNRIASFLLQIGWKFFSFISRHHHDNVCLDSDYNLRKCN